MTEEAGTGGIPAVLRGLVREMRPWQWYKQFVMLFGIVFSRNLLDPVRWANLAVAVVTFTAVVGAVYIFNDVSDLEEDRNHPEKRHRPMASGQVPVPVGVATGVLLLSASLAAAAWLGPLFLAVLLAYLVQNVLYSWYLKEVAIVDVMVVAVGFVLRAIAGVVAIDVSLSPWLIVCTFLLALVLALGKRRYELGVTDDPAATRGVLAEYTVDTLDDLLVIATGTLLMAYSLYTFFRTDPRMMLTLPFAFFGVFRYHHLVHTSNVAGRPEYLLADRPTVANAVLWGTIAIGVLYDVPARILRVIG